MAIPVNFDPYIFNSGLIYEVWVLEEGALNVLFGLVGGDWLGVSASL